MPTFRFLNTETGEEFEDFLTNSRRVDLLEKNPHIQQLPSAFSIASMTGDIHSKTDDTWKEVLSKVSEAHPLSPVAEKHGKRSIKQIKTSQAIQKHVGRWRNS
jgi:hypothetical protein